LNLLALVDKIAALLGANHSSLTLLIGAFISLVIDLFNHSTHPLIHAVQYFAVF